MDRRERSGDPEETFRIAAEGQQAKVWTALPGIVASFDAAAMTCTVQPSISGTRLKSDGSVADIKMPVLLDCPVCFPGGGGATLTFPIKPGDECLVVFSSRCIDAWWQLGGVQGQAELRMHDLSDGFVLPGVRSQPRRFNVSESAVQLRTDDGVAFVEIATATHKIKAKTSGNVEIEAANITIKGNIFLDGPVTQQNTAGGSTTATMIGPIVVTNDVTAGGKSLKTHVHSGVQTGPGNTGQPV